MAMQCVYSHLRMPSAVFCLFRHNGVRYPNYFSKRLFSAGAATHYDVAVVGGGPGGYVAAIKAAQLGLKTICVEKRGTLGGTCLNVGCIPSKTLLNITHKYHELLHVFPKFGITTLNPTVELSTVMKQKNEAVKGLTGGIEFLFKKNKVTYVKGEAKLTSGEALVVSPIDGSTPLSFTADNIIVATGSEVAHMPNNTLTIDEKVIISSTGALSLPTIPKKMIIIGGGVIGLELGSVWARLGTQIHVLEYLDRICPAVDLEAAKVFQKSLEKQGFQFTLSSKVVGADVHSNGATVHIESVKDGKTSLMEADVVLVAVGRKPYTKGLGLEELGIETDKMNRIIVNENYQVPNYPNIRAIGDVIAGPMLAHKAEEEGIAVVERIANQGGHVNYNAIPSVIYTAPEVAGVGATEEQLEASGVNYVKGSFPFAANSRARVNASTEGFVKILADKETDRILGGWIVGDNAGELLSELVLGMEYGASSEDIGRTCHSHPTLCEAVKEACMAVFSKPIHNV